MVSDGVLLSSVNVHDEADKTLSKRHNLLTGGPRSNFLRKVNLEIVNNEFCNAKQICSYASYRDLCTYDSGGPLFMTNNSLTYNVGIVSYGIACATKKPAANTRVASYLDWIMNKTKSTVFCIR